MRHCLTWVIVDYDDETIDRGLFLNRFVSEDLTMQVMLVSLKDSGAVVVYDRRMMTPAQAGDWLSFSWLTDSNLAPDAPPQEE
jgi:cytochrome c oxidase subunit 2